MKKIILFTFSLLFSIFSFSTASVNSYDENGWKLSEQLESLLWSTDLVKGWWDNLLIDQWFSEYIKWWTNNISLYLWVLAVFWIALGAFMLVISSGEDDKVTKAKTIIKWSIIWFVCVLTAALIINLIIKIMYSKALTWIIIL